jgi:hypothetical protein
MIYITMYPLPQRINHNAQTLTDYGGSRGGGARFYKDGRFYHVGDHGYWWTATEVFLGSPHIRTIDHKGGHLAEYDHDKRYGLSARCVQNKRKAQKQGD